MKINILILVIMFSVSLHAIENSESCSRFFLNHTPIQQLSNFNKIQKWVDLYVDKDPNTAVYKTVKKPFGSQNKIKHKMTEEDRIEAEEYIKKKYNDWIRDNTDQELLRDQQIAENTIAQLKKIPSDELAIVNNGFVHSLHLYYQMSKELLDSSLFIGMSRRSGDKPLLFVTQLNQKMRDWVRRIKKSNELDTSSKDELINTLRNMVADISERSNPRHQSNIHTGNPNTTYNFLVFSTLPIEYQYESIPEFQKLNQRISEGPSNPSENADINGKNIWVFSEKHNEGALDQFELMPSAKDIKQMGYKKVHFLLESFVVNRSIETSDLISHSKFKYSFREDTDIHDSTRLLQSFGIPMYSFLYGEKSPTYYPQFIQINKIAEQLRRNSVAVEFRGIEPESEADENSWKYGVLKPD